MAKERQSGSAGERRSVSARGHRVMAWCVTFVLVMLVQTVHVHAAPPDTEGSGTIAITGDRLSGFVLPVEPLHGEIVLESLSANAWTVDDTKRLMLVDNVRIVIAGHEFTTDRALVWLNRIPSQQGTINQIAVYADQLSDPARRAGSGISGAQPLITASTIGDVTLRPTLLEPSKPAANSLMTRGEARLAEYLKSIMARNVRLQRSPLLEQPPERTPPKPVPGGPVNRSNEFVPQSVALPPVISPLPPLIVPEGQLRFQAGNAEFITGKDENVAVISDGVTVEYISGASEDRYSRLTISAEKAVVFSDPASIDDMMHGALDAKSVHGVYLEGNVVASVNGEDYVVRTPRAYYDFRTGQAVMVDAILRTYRRKDNRLIYVRAKELRQVAANQWEGDHVVVSTSEFFRPTIALGASSVTVTQEAGADGDDVTHIESRHNTLNIVGVPVAYWPKFSGTTEDVALRDISFDSQSTDGLGIQTTWDLYTLLGIERPAGTDLALRADGYTKRGGGGGLVFKYDLDDMRGAVDLYGLFDEGIDRTSSGIKVKPEDTFRGAALFEHSMRLTPHWWLQAQGAWISDPSFITTWREEDFRNRREYETSLYLKYQNGGTAFTALAKSSVNDFISNSYLLAGQAYAVEKFPEVGYYRLGDSFFGDSVTYSSRTTVARVRLQFERNTPAQLGVPGSAFGIGPMTPVSSMLLASGLRENSVSRFDTRHEFEMPMDVGPFRVVPFVVGRFTAYDQDFKTYSTDANQYRIFGSAGVRLSTQIQHVNNAVESRLFDLHRLRHIIEPMVTAWAAASSVEEGNYPVYDLDVEGVGNTEAVEFSLRNTFQTQRGGPGQWRSADVLVFEPAIVLTATDDRTKSPVPQFFEYWPEYSQFGNHAKATASWLISDSLTLGGTVIYDLDNELFARSSIGVEMRHSPDLTTYIEYRALDASNTELLEAGINYRMTKQYRFIMIPQWDFRAEDFRALTLRVIRSFPDFDLILTLSHDAIRKETTYGASIRLAEF